MLEDTDYADDLALVSHTEDHMQDKTKKLEKKNTEMIALTINDKKTKLMYINTERLSAEGTLLVTKDSFNYQGLCITTQGGAGRDI